MFITGTVILRECFCSYSGRRGSETVPSRLLVPSRPRSIISPSSSKLSAEPSRRTSSFGETSVNCLKGWRRGAPSRFGKPADTTSATPSRSPLLAATRIPPRGHCETDQSGSCGETRGQDTVPTCKEQKAEYRPSRGVSRRGLLSRFPVAPHPPCRPANTIYGETKQQRRCNLLAGIRSALSVVSFRIRVNHTKDRSSK